MGNKNKQKNNKNIGGLPFRIEMTYTEIFVPKKNIFILCNYIRMQESFGEPPATLTSFNYYFDKYMNCMSCKKLTILFDSSRKHELHVHSMDTGSSRPKHHRNEKA